MRIARITACILALALVLPAALTAQESAPTPSSSDVSLDDARSDVQAARDRLHLLLLRPDVRRVAQAEDIDLRSIHEGIDRLPAATLAKIAPYADAVEGTAAQSAITISTTTIIIILLVLILVLLID